jgi:hypothetical protein
MNGIAYTMELHLHVLWYHVDRFVKRQTTCSLKSAIQHSTVPWFWWVMVLPAVMSPLDNEYMVVIGSARMKRK